MNKHIAFTCDNVDLRGGFLLGVYDCDRDEARWVNELGLYGQHSALGIVALHDKLYVLVQDDSWSSSIAVLNQNFDVLALKFNSALTSAAKIFCCDEQLIFAVGSLLLSADSSIGYANIYLDLKDIGFAGYTCQALKRHRDHFFLALENTDQKKGLIYELTTKKILVSGDFCPKDFYFLDDNLYLIDARSSAILICDENGSIVSSIGLGTGFPKCAISFEDELLIFVSAWRRYHKRAPSRGKWDQMPEWIRDAHPMAFFESSLTSVKQSKIASFPFSHFATDISGAILLPFSAQEYFIRNKDNAAAKKASAEKLAFVEQLNSLKKLVSGG
ncbi:hypothetical protein ACN429_23280 [Pseudomonas oryzihabitans]|uniref:hypothetical protein n=1 Tax=Pseudomonas oryzihabitans TaxID=47885 RepID=UPI003638852D